MSTTPNSIPNRSIVEGLEDRRLMAATIEFLDGVLTVRGDPNAVNQVRVFSQGRNLVALAGSVRHQVRQADVRQIRITGGNLNDRLQLAEGLTIPASIDGGAGHDQIYGAAANDTLFGGLGNDKLVGRRGNDHIVGGGGTDVYVGGAGRNSYDRSQPQWIDEPEQEPVPDPNSNPSLAAPYPTSVVERPVTLQHPNGGSFSLGRNVKLFRNADGTTVAGDGIQDDTTGIQRAIDSLPNSQGMPQGNVASGGTLLFPPGTYRITQPLRVPGGVILSGVGPATVLNYVGTGYAVEFVEDPEFPNNFVSGAGARDMTIRSETGGGFTVVSSKRLFVTLMRFRDLVMDTVGWGINFPWASADTQNCYFDNVLFRNPGAGAMHIRGNANKINAIRVEGQARPGYRAEPGLVVAIGSGTSISNSLISGPVADSTVGFYVNGGLGGGLHTFTNNRVDAPDVAGPGGLARFVFENLEGVSIDDLGGRKTKIIATNAIRLARQWSDGNALDLARFLEVDTNSRVLIDDVYSTVPAGLGNNPRGKIFVTRWNVATGPEYEAAGGPDAVLPPSPALGRMATAMGVNAREFTSDDGVAVRGDGVHDDTTGIQKAINLFLANRDNPNAPQSGAVYLPTGVYRITAPLTLPSGVVLVGDGSGSVIRYMGAGGTAIRFSDPSGTVTGAGVENLGIGAENGGGIGDVAGMPVVNVRMTDLVFNCLGWGIDLRDLRNSTISNTHQKQMGTGSIRVQGNHNLVYGANTEFGTRPGFNADPALVTVKGDYNSIIGGIIEGVYSGTAHAFYVSGTGVKFANNWTEITTNGPLDAKGGVAFIFENARDAKIQDFYLLNSKHRAQFKNSTASIALFDTLAESLPLKDYIVIDANSSLTVEFALTRHGVGTLPAGVTANRDLVLIPGGDMSRYGTWV